LLSICEGTGITLSVGLTPTPAACGQDIPVIGFLTGYLYDAFGNLKTVTQGGLNSRTFNYDSLSRLTSASNPESGTTTYEYDSDTACASPNSFPGQLVSRVDARGIRTCQQYDALNRLTVKYYSDSTLSAYFTYDVAPAWMTDLTNIVGRLTVANNSSAGSTDGKAMSATFSYDTMGHVVREWEQTPAASPGGNFLYYTYDLAGDLASSTNGAGVTLSYNYNPTNRLTSLTSSQTGTGFPGTLLSAVTYNALGAPLTDTLGANAKTESRTYTPRGLLQALSTLQGTTLRYNFGLTFAPNGNILTGNDSANGNWTYTYDDFNRLLSANATGQAYTYDYDRFGNRWHQNGPHMSSLGFDANNRIVSGSGVTYDPAGNVTADGLHTYTYDAENRVTAVDGGATARYVYDVNGQRIRKTTGSVSVDYLHDLAGHAITELSSTLAWNRGEVYAGGRHLATYSGGTGGTTYFVDSDWLGTERTRVTYSGAPYESCTSFHFGDWLSCTGTDPSPMHFTGKQRDTESGLDNLGARFYTSSMGRFMSPDPLGGSMLNPQSFNRYAYALNDPCNQVDPFGLKSTPCKLNLKILSGNGVTLSEAEKAAITNRINSLLASAQAPDKDGVELQTSYSGKTDYTLNFSNAGDDKLEAQYLLGGRVTLGDAPIGGASGNVYPDAVGFASFLAGGKMSQLMLLGGVAAHELVHMAGRFKDEPFSILMVNTMMQDSAPKDLLDNLFSNPNSALWMITSAQLQAMFLDCVTKHPEQKPPRRRGGGGGGDNWNSGGFSVDCYSIGPPENTQTFCSIFPAGGGGFGGGRGGTVR